MLRVRLLANRFDDKVDEGPHFWGQLPLAEIDEVQAQFKGLPIRKQRRERPAYQVSADYERRLQDDPAASESKFPRIVTMISGSRAGCGAAGRLPSSLASWNRDLP